MINQVLKNLENYFKWEKDFDFSGWQDIHIYTGTTLSEAWIKARPNDACKFEDPEFKDFVNQANGKWLEKQYLEDNYKVLLKITPTDDTDEVSAVLAHELRHCLDYINAVNNLQFEEYTYLSPDHFYVNWSEFRATMVSFRYQFYNITKMKNPAKESYFEELASLLGFWTADTMEGLLCATDKREELYFLSRYMGAARAARNLNEKFVRAKSFYFWHLIPLTVYKKYGDVFYLANEWEEIDICKLDQTCGYNYQRLLESVNSEATED